VTEEIVLLDAAGRAVGTAPKRASHHADTPLHLAFSCYLVDARGRVLLTRRAAGKTFAGVLTNSCCGHPGPGEPLADAVRRRVDEELGLTAEAVRLVLPDFRYRAEQDGVVENEYCPVFRARADGPARPDPAEVSHTAWLPWPEVVAAAARPEASPWFRAQMARLVPLGDPARWPAGDPAALPPAARNLPTAPTST
jgi:isopentenyl-diphosphate Delta-isomerase